MKDLLALKSYLQHRNVKAFLFMLRRAEGTSSANGYRYLFGSSPRNEKLFDSYTDHPNIKTAFTNSKGQALVTSAAGAYQFLHSTWMQLKDKLHLQDFSPENQDLAALQLIMDAGALEDIIQRDIKSALQKVKKIWASLPGAGYHQHEHAFIVVIRWYTSAGGKAKLSIKESINLFYVRTKHVLSRTFRRYVPVFYFLHVNLAW